MRRDAGAPVRAAAVLLALAAGGCSLTSNKVLPLAGEDPRALEVSGERAAWLQRTGATRAVEDLRKALREGQEGTALGLLGPRTREAAREAAKAAGAGPEEMLSRERAGALGTEAAAMLDLLRSEGTARLREPGPFDPARRTVTVLLRVGERDEVPVPAVYTDGGWRVELVPAADDGAPAPGKGGAGG